MAEFEFSIRATIRRSWQIFRTHGWFFVGLSVVMFALSYLSNMSDSIIVKIVAAIAGLVWSYVTLSCALAAVDTRENVLSFSALKSHTPTTRQLLRMIGIALVATVIITAGFVMLVIPGIYFLIRLMFSNFTLVDRREGVVESMRFSWRLVKGEMFWTVLLAFFVTIVLVVGGLFIALVGVLVTYPIALLFLARLYRDLVRYQEREVVVQPAEITSAQTSSPAV